MRKDSSLAEALGALPDNPLPHALSIHPAADASSSTTLSALRQYLTAWPEVELVQLDSDWVRRLDAILLLMQRITLGIGTLLGIGVLAVIGNTIRLEINGRRQEIEITQLVGGSAAFVRRPFLYTGALYGLLGSLLAAGIVQTAGALVAGPVNQLARSYGSQFALQPLGGQGLGLMLAVGALLGLAGAWLAAARHISRLQPRA
jgi:cell division transport system permease protein